MEPKDLRIGNWVYSTITESYIQVSALISDTQIAAEPIPLTEEWLLKFGFDNLGAFGFGIGEFYMESTKNLRGDYKSKYVFRILSRKVIQIKHVHQLQNLFFALTGEELTIDT